MKIELEISDEILSDVIGGAAIGYWSCVRRCTWDESKPLPERLTFEVWEDGDTGRTVHQITPELLARGFRVALEKYPSHAAALIGGYENGPADATTGDVLLQCAIFGELKYG